jgi:signal transduction histidine kinase
LRAYIGYSLLAFAAFLPLSAFAQGAETLSLLPFLFALTFVALVAVGVSVFFFLRYRDVQQTTKEQKLIRERLDDLLSSAPGGYYYWDVRYHREEFSPVLERLLNFLSGVETFEQLLGYFEGEYRERLKKLFQELQAGKKNFVTHLRADVRGQERHFQCSGDRINDLDGAMVGIILWFQDITVFETQQHILQNENHALEKRLGLLSLMLNNVPYPVWVRGPQLAIEFVNAAYHRHIGDIGANVVEGSAAGLPELSDKSRPLAQWVKETNKTREERHHIVVEGKRRLYQFQELPLEEKRGTLGVAFDITSLELVEKEVERHISAQADLLESTSSATAIFGADTRLKYYNNAYAKLWQLDEKWLASHPTYGEVLEILREKRKLPEQSDFPKFKREQLQWFTNLIEPYNDFLYLPDGKTLHLIVIPHALGGILIAYEDMTDKIALERSYNTLIAVQRATLDNLHEAVAVFGQNGRLRLSNPVYARMWKVDPTFLATEPHLVDLMERTKFLHSFDEEWEPYRNRTVDYIMKRTPGLRRLERTDGSVIEIASVPLPDGATLMTYVDVTDSTLVERSLRERNEALKEADRLKTEFLANVSYELRSPLTSIVGFSEVLSHQYFGELNDRQREYVTGIHKSSQYLMGLINDILDLASIEAGYMVLEVERFDIHEALSSVQGLIQERLRENSLTFTFECSGGIGKMWGDGRRIRQVVFKLVSNAIKFTEAGGKITLGAKKGKKGEIDIWVEDSGAGIPADEQRAVFDKFHRSNPTGRAPGRLGAGLGLSVVKSFVELHGGTVELYSKPGVGTKVVCHLPRDNAELKNIDPWKVGSTEEGDLDAGDADTEETVMPPELHG